MSLQTELDAFRAAWEDRVGADIAGLVARDNAALAGSGLPGRATRTGAPFPSVQLSDQLGRPVDIATLAADGPVVVTFYRGGWCPYCSLELRAWQKAMPDLARLGARLVAVSSETPDNALDTAEKNDLAFTVLSDSGGKLAHALGIRFALSPEIKALYQKFGHDLPAHNGDGAWSLPMPATFVVARSGQIVLAEIDPDYRRRMEPAAALAALGALVAEAV